MEQQTAVCVSITNIIRNRSKTGQLIEADEILAQLTGPEMPEMEVCPDKKLVESMLKEVLEENQDLREISNRDGMAYYYSVQSLTESYANILVWKTENPLRLIAEVVRKDSRLYPRPVPVDSFRESPFELTVEQILECLAVMDQQEEYRDIAQTTSSVGTQFLYSIQYMDPDHAAMLAEWFDVGQADNP